MFRDVLPLDEHVGLADGVGLVIELLAEHGQSRLRIVLRQILAGDGEHAAGACRRVIDGANDARLGQDLVVFDEQQIDHEPDDLAGSEMLSGGLVGDFGELADQLLEDGAHLGIADRLGCRSIPANFSATWYSRPAVGEPIDLGVELEALEDVANRWENAWI